MQFYRYIIRNQTVNRLLKHEVRFLVVVFFCRSRRQSECCHFVVEIGGKFLVFVESKGVAQLHESGQEPGADNRRSRSSLQGVETSISRQICIFQTETGPHFSAFLFLKMNRQNSPHSNKPESSLKQHLLFEIRSK